MREEGLENTSVERLLTRHLEDGGGDFGRPLSDRARQAQRSVESYLKSGGHPRWMERVMEIDRRVETLEKRLAETYRELRSECRDDGSDFPRRWHERVDSLDFGDLNGLIAEHNEWYPIERDLPMNPRTGEYVQVSGRSFRRPTLDAAWVLARFPAS